MDFASDAIIVLGWFAATMAFLAACELFARVVERSMRHIDVRPVTIRIRR